MKCPKCNFEVSEHTKFCPECGEKLSAQSAEASSGDAQEKSKTATGGDRKKNSILKWSLILSCVVLFLGLVAYFVAYPFIAQAYGDYSVIINMYHIREYKVPEGTTEINAGAFGFSENPTSIILPNRATLPSLHPQNNYCTL